MKKPKIAYFGFHPVYKVYWKWFIPVYDTLRYKFDLNVIPYNRIVFNNPLSKRRPISIFPAMYEYMTHKRIIQKMDIAHVLTQVGIHYEIHKILKKRPPNITRVITIHDIFDRYGGINEAIIQEVEDTVDKIFTPSKFTRKIILQHSSSLSRSDVSVIYNPAPPNFYKDDKTTVKSIRKSILEKIRKPVDTKILIYVGTDKPSKNVKKLIHTFKYLINIDQDIALIIVGPISQSTEKNIIRDDSIKGNIILRRNVDDTTLNVLYNISDAFISLSIAEGFGMPLVEAMCTGTPVIASKASAIPEIAGNAALLINPYLQPEDLANVIYDKLINSVLLRELSFKGLKQCKKFNIRNITERYILEYYSLLGDTNGK